VTDSSNSSSAETCTNDLSPVESRPDRVARHVRAVREASGGLTDIGDSGGR
jgi:hypothetical protein